MALYLSVDAYAEGAVLPVSATPFTMACWFRADDITNRHTLMSIGNGGTGASQQFWEIRAAGNVAGDPIEARAQSGTGGSNAVTTTGYSATTWHHACGVFTSSTSRTAYIDGGSANTETTSRAPTGVSGTTIGRRYGIADSTSDLNGRIAEMAIWNVALTAAEVAALAAGASPTRIRPDALVWYNAGHEPVSGTIYSQVRGGNGLAITGTITIQDHAPKVWVPFGADVWARYASAGGTTFPVSLTAGITPAGALFTQSNKRLAAGITPAGALLTQSNKLLTAGITPSGALLTQSNQLLTAGITPSAAATFVKTKVVALTAGLTPAGALFTQSNKLLTAALTPAANLLTQSNKRLAAALTPAGALFAQTNKQLAAALTPSAAVTFIKTKVVNLTAGVTPAGALLTQSNKLLTAGLTPAAALLTQTTKRLAAGLTPAAAVLTQTNKRLAAGITPTAAASFVRNLAGATFAATVEIILRSATSVETVLRATSVEIVQRAAAAIEIVMRRSN